MEELSGLVASLFSTPAGLYSSGLAKTYPPQETFIIGSLAELCTFFLKPIQEFKEVNSGCLEDSSLTLFLIF